MTEFSPAPPLGIHPAGYAKGVAMVLLAGVCLSSGGLIVRHIETADGWQVLFYRSISFAVTVLLFLLWRYQGRVVEPFKQIGGAGAVVALALGVGFSCYLFGMIMTTVANVSFTIAASPFMAALLAWILLREKVSLVTWVAMVASLIGIGIMFADGLAAGSWIGNLVTLGAPLTYAVMIVALRHAKARDMMPATCLAGVVSAAISLTMVEAPLTGGLAIPPGDLILSLLLGSVQIGFGFILITLATRSVPAAEVGLLSLTETLLAPLWVWLIISEEPAWLTLLGGAVVLIAVLGQGLWGLKIERGARSYGG